MKHFLLEYAMKRLTVSVLSVAIAFLLTMVFQERSARLIVLNMIAVGIGLFAVGVALLALGCLALFLLGWVRQSGTEAGKKGQ